MHASPIRARRALAAAALSVSTLGAGVVAAADPDRFATKPELEALSGTYASPAPEEWYGGFGTREFAFADGRWSLVFTHALDPAMEARTFRFRTEGPYGIGAPSEAVADAWEGDFTEERKYVTLLTEDPEIVEAFGMTDCGLEHGVETDVSERGCAAWRPVAVCGVDHDLLAMDGADLYFGVRPADNDLCTPDRRPTALLPAVVRR